MTDCMLWVLYSHLKSGPIAFHVHLLPSMHPVYRYDWTRSDDLARVQVLLPPTWVPRNYGLTVECW